MITIIGISGKKLSGKDTLCKALLDNADVKGIRIGFADALKEEVARACGVSVNHIEQNKDRFRVMLQWWGTDFKRHYNGPTYWVNQALIKVDHALAKGNQLIVIPDVRFLSEAKPLCELGAHLIRIARPTHSSDTHTSETELDNFKHFNHIVLNRGTILDLEEEARHILQQINVPLKNLSTATIQ